jgi:hypothetical protein
MPFTERNAVLGNLLQADLTGLWHAKGYGENKVTRSKLETRQKTVKGC